MEQIIQTINRKQKEFTKSSVNVMQNVLNRCSKLERLIFHIVLLMEPTFFTMLQ